MTVLDARSWPTISALAFACSLASVHCTPGGAIGTDDLVTGASKPATTANVVFHLSSESSAEAPANAPDGSARAPSIVAIRSIVLSGASGENAEVYACPGASAEACTVDVSDDAALAALMTSPADVAAGTYDTVLLRTASPEDVTVAVALPAPVTLSAGEDAVVAIQFQPVALERAITLAAIFAPRHQVAIR